MNKEIEQLCKMPNIGLVLAQILISIEVYNPEILKYLGAEKAFIRIAAIHKHACLHKLYAIEGAVQNIRWHNLNEERKHELKVFFNSLSR